MDFDGSEILAELASRGLLEKFFEAVDNDDLDRIIHLLRSIDIEEDAIREVLEQLDS